MTLSPRHQGAVSPASSTLCLGTWHSKRQPQEWEMGMDVWALRVREKSKKMKDLFLGFGLLVMGSHKFRWQTMNRKEFCSSRPDHPFPCSGWIKPYLKLGGRNHESTAEGKENKWGGLNLILNLFMILKEDWGRKEELSFLCFYSDLSL